MKKIFNSYYQQDKEKLDELWDKAIFVLDTNVLLNLYRYPKEARNALIKTLKHISGRLWIPHQVALEYQENRLNVIAEQVKRFDEVVKIVKEIQTSLNGQLDKLQLKKRHSSINPDNLLEKVDSAFSEYLESLNKLKSNQPKVTENDKIRDTITNLFDNKVGEPYNQQKLNEIYSEGKIRYELKRPPGYEDKDKSNNYKIKNVYFYNELVIKSEFGDLILWQQLIDKAKESNWKHVIFISDDSKEDWWWITESQGKKTIGVRPEILMEIYNKADVSSFYMYRPEKFMELANKYLKLDLSDISIEQVRTFESFIIKPKDTYDNDIQDINDEFDIPSELLIDKSYKAGEKVDHKKFGRGEVLFCEGEGDNERVYVDFENYGIKKLLIKFACLQRSKFIFDILKTS